LQAQDHGATADRILRIASKLFAEKGFANVSIRDVCREAGTTAPVIYYYFGSKKGLFDAVAKKGISMGGFLQTVTRAAGGPDPRKSLKRFVETYLKGFPEHAFDPGLYMRESATLDRESADIISADLDKIHSAVSSMVAKGVGKGAFRKVDPDMAADALMGMLNRVIFQGIHFSKTSDRLAYGGFVTEFFLKALER
jgi:AcrR family transcriptional regulator